MNKPRFDNFSEHDDHYLRELYYMARAGGLSRHASLCHATEIFHRERPDVNKTRTYKELCSALEPAN
jgi:purine-nucleoside phosphorylase